MYEDKKELLLEKLEEEYRNDLKKEKELEDEKDLEGF